MFRYRGLLNLETEDSRPKIILAVGDSFLEIKKMESMISTRENRAEFVKRSIRFLRLWKFDGIDLNFAYLDDNLDSPDGKFKWTMLCQVKDLPLFDFGAGGGGGCIIYYKV